MSIETDALKLIIEQVKLAYEDIYLMLTQTQSLRARRVAKKLETINQIAKNALEKTDVFDD